MVNLFTDLAYYFCLALAAALTQPDHLLAEPCSYGDESKVFDVSYYREKATASRSTSHFLPKSLKHDPPAFENFVCLRGSGVKSLSEHFFLLEFV